MCTSLTFDKIMMVGAMSQLAMACITLCSPSVVMGVSLPHPSSTHPLFPWEMSNVRALSPSPQVVTPMHVHGAVMEMHAWLGRACFIAGHTRNRERAKRICVRPLRDLSSKRIDAASLRTGCIPDGQRRAAMSCLVPQQPCRNSLDLARTPPLGQRPP